MRSFGHIVAIATLAGTVGGCAQESYYPRSGYSQTTYYPATTTAYYPGSNYSNPAYPPSSSYPNYTRSNVYSSRSDYYRNYQGIHDGPERTGP